MSRVAFYAPMKSPHSPTPSGDREMARNLITALAAEGDHVDLVSELRIYDKHGDSAKQHALRAAAEAETQRLITELPQDTQLWVTYHNYYKAPDLIGPQVCAARRIPYVQMESTRASSRLKGPWAGPSRSDRGRGLEFRHRSGFSDRPRRRSARRTEPPGFRPARGSR